ncbi:unnamed protein product [Nesidiocoris tenuis]|uniref:LRRNT domain-containing protein n=1 Tax=Nesidiocoris tenuis TaxID=355587 RepID=A0A6H5G4P9_9HEMI|nr:unnamed protein product [Nesidiocoris tenuis]
MEVLSVIYAPLVFFRLQRFISYEKRTLKIGKQIIFYSKYLYAHCHLDYSGAEGSTIATLQCVGLQEGRPQHCRAPYHGSQRQSCTVVEKLEKPYQLKRKKTKNTHTVSLRGRGDRRRVVVAEEEMLLGRIVAAVLLLLSSSTTACPPPPASCLCDASGVVLCAAAGFTTIPKDLPPTTTKLLHPPPLMWLVTPFTFARIPLRLSNSSDDHQCTTLIRIPPKCWQCSVDKSAARPKMKIGLAVQIENFLQALTPVFMKARKDLPSGPRRIPVVEINAIMK